MIKRNTGNPEVDANVVDLDDRLKALEAASLLRGRHVSGVTLAAGVAKKVRHQLGRTPLGYLNAGMTGAVAAGYINVISRDADFLELKATGYGATITLALWVY
jgi:hypothetical protein